MSESTFVQTSGFCWELSLTLSPAPILQDDEREREEEKGTLLLLFYFPSDVPEDFL